MAPVLKASDRDNGRHEAPLVTRLPGTTITATWEYITPALAAEYLKQNTANRNFMPSASAIYHRDMQDNDWVITHEGIAFTESGILADGQHRLTAIVNSGVSCWFLVTRGLTEKAIEVINRGRLRTLAHNLQILGFTGASPRLAAVARMAYKGAAQVNRTEMPTDQAMRRFIETHLDALRFAMEAIPEKTAPAPVAALVARAWYHVADQQLLRRYGAAINDQIPREEQRVGDKSARLLGKFLVGSRAKGGYVAQIVCYRRAQSSLRAYLDGRDLESLRETHEDLFPLPTEK